MLKLETRYYNDRVPFNEKDKKWIRDEIGRQTAEVVAQQITLAVAALRPRGWHRFTHWLKAWSLTAAAFSILVGMLGIIVALSINLVSGAKTNEHRLTGIEDRLTSIEARLRLQTAAQTPRQALKELSSLEPKNLAINLPALRIVSEQPISKVAPAPSELHRVASNLAKVNPTTDNYWPTVLRFIQFASAEFATNAPPPGSKVTFHLSDNIDFGENGLAGFTIPPKSVIEMDGNVFTNETFTDSRIIFTGKPSILRNVKFIECAFEFPTADEPTPFLEAAGRQLLASGIQTAYIEGL